VYILNLLSIKKNRDYQQEKNITDVLKNNNRRKFILAKGEISTFKLNTMCIWTVIFLLLSRRWNA